MRSLAARDGRSWTAARLASGTLMLLALAGFHASVPPLGASRSAAATSLLTDEQMDRFQVWVRRAERPEGVGPGTPSPGADRAPSPAERAEPAAVVPVAVEHVPRRAAEGEPTRRRMRAGPQRPEPLPEAARLGPVATAAPRDADTPTGAARVRQEATAGRGGDAPAEAVSLADGIEKLRTALVATKRRIEDLERPSGWR